LSDETKIELFGHMTMKEKGGCLQAKENHPIEGGSIMLWGFFAAGGTGGLHKIDGIMRTEHYVDILKQHLKTSVANGSSKWTITPIILPKLWQNG
jgi:hypothetical protein